MAIAFENEFHLDQQPRVPMRLRHAVDQRMDKARAVSIVRRYEDDNRQSKVNKFPLTETHTTRPRETVDEVAQAVCDVMQHYALGVEAEDGIEDIAEGLVFSVRFHYFGSGQRGSTFKWTWKVDRRDEEEIEADEVMSLLNPDLEEGSHVYLHAVIRQTMELVERVQLQKERSDSRLLEMADRMQKPIEMIDRQAQYSHSVLMQGMQALVNALELRYDHDKAFAAESAKAERWDRVLETLATTVGPAAKIGLQQVAMWLGNKANGGGRVPRAESFRNGDAPPSSHSAPRAEPSAESSSAPNAEADAAPTPDEALVELVASFSESLRPQQRKSIRKKLTPKTLDLFDDLLASDTAEQARESFAALNKHLHGNIAPLMGAAEDLDDEQQRCVMGFISLLMAEDAEAEDAKAGDAEGDEP